MPKVSVVIPCYNQGHFVEEAVDSVLKGSYHNFEIIVVNDGSSDPQTNRILERFTKEKTRIITTTNQGLAAARNNGIEVALGEYILPLDADDKIGPDYIKDGVQVLEAESEVGIVYCRASLFGAVDTEWELPVYSLERMILDNVIFCSALFRRSDWKKVGGYDVKMVYGWEDYDFWLSLIELGRKVVRLNSMGFHYRVASDSMVRSTEKWQKVEMFKRIYKKHQRLIADNIEVWLDALLEVTDRYYTSRLYYDCGQGISDELSVARKIEQGTRRIVFDLRGGENLQAIRFDPVDTWAIVEIDTIAVIAKDGKRSVIPGGNVTSNACYQKNGQLFFDSRDPQCFFSFLGPQELKELVELDIKLRYCALGEAALTQIIDLQKELLQKKNQGRARQGFLGKLRNLISPDSQ